MSEFNETLLTIAGSITGFTAVLTALSKTFRGLVLSPFVKAKDKIDISHNNLKFIKDVQDFQKEELDKLLLKLKEQSAIFQKELDETKKAFDEKSRELETIIEKKDAIINRLWKHIYYQEGLLKANNIEHKEINL